MVVVQSVADHKGVRHYKSGVVCLDGLRSPFRLIQQSADADGSGFAQLEHIQQIVQGISGINDILYNKNFFILKRLVQILDDLYNSA